jgi:glucose/arabinose dehydrogenase
MISQDFTRKFSIAGKRIMNKHRMTAMMAAVAFAGFMHALAAQENMDIAPADNTSQQITSEQKPPEETPAPVVTTPAEALAQSNDKLLSEMKVYPSF